MSRPLPRLRILSLSSSGGDSPIPTRNLQYTQLVTPKLVDVNVPAAVA